MTEESNFLKPESTFAELGIETMFTEPFKNDSEMLGMFFFGFGINEDIIDKDYDERI